MALIKDDAEGGIASFLDEQRNLSDADGNAIEISVSIAQFDDQFEWVERTAPIDEVKTYTLRPRGATALLDAVGKGLVENSERLGSAAPDKKVCVIVTDGKENSSKEWSKSGVTELIDQYKARDWEFVFLASDEFTVAMGQDMGLNTSQYEATGAGTRTAYHTTSRSVGSYLSGTSSKVDTPDRIAGR